MLLLFHVSQRLLYIFQIKMAINELLTIACSILLSMATMLVPEALQHKENTHVKQVISQFHVCRICTVPICGGKEKDIGAQLIKLHAIKSVQECRAYHIKRPVTTAGTLQLQSRSPHVKEE